MPNREPQVKTIRSSNGLTAAAIRMTRTTGEKTVRQRRVKAPPWYSECWNFFNTIGEYRYAVTWVGNLLSRATLVVWKDGKLVTDEADLGVMGLKSFFGGEDGQREMLRKTGIHLTVPGDVYLIGEDMGEDKADRWRVVSATRVKVQNRTDDYDGDWSVDKVPLKPDTIIIRLYREHPDKADESDSPSQAVLPVLRELDALGKMVASQIASRLTGAGIFLIPNEMSFGAIRSGIAPAEGEDEATVQANTLDAFLIELMETIMAATEDPSDPAARTPILFQGPGEHLDKVRLVTFWTELQKEAKNLRDEQIRRLALGMDMPPEILTGTEGVNHWGMWQVEEASIKSHTEPLLHIITSGITESWFRPYLIDQGMTEEEADSYVIVADTTKIRLRPNRSKEAIELYDRGVLSTEATAKENGFDPADLNDDAGRLEFFKRKVASGSTTPELVAWALSQLGLPIPQGMLVVPEQQTQAPDDRSLLEHPTNDPPSDENADMAAAGVVVFRALERAGAKLRTKYASSLVAGAESISNDKLYRYAHIDPSTYDDLLAGAWECIDGLNLNVSPAALDSYVRHLFDTSQSHVDKALQFHLRQVRAVR